LVEGSPGFSEVIAHYARTGEPLAYMEPSTPRFWEPRYSLQLAFFVTHPPPLTLSLRPHCHLGIYRCQRSQETRAATSPPPPPTVDTWKKVYWWNRSLRWFRFSYFFVLIRFSFSHIGYYLNVFVWLCKSWYGLYYTVVRIPHNIYSSPDRNFPRRKPSRLAKLNNHRQYG